MPAGPVLTLGAQDLPPELLPLPVMRADLQVFPGPQARDGSPTFTLFDPLNRAYFKLGWAEHLIMSLMRGPQTAAGVLEHLARHTTLRFSATEVLALGQQFAWQGLTSSTVVRPVEDLLAARRARRMHPLRWAIEHYIYFRLPLLRPDRFLTRTLAWVRPLGSPLAQRLYLLLACLALFLWLPRLEAYFHTFTYFFNFSGLLGYGLALAVLKAVHEFSHAYVAKHFGVRVPVMGINFIVLWPLAYSDVTDAWRLASRRQRLAIAVAGMAAELVMACLALLGWCLTPPGILNSLFFFFSSVSLASSFLINLNPGMRWDGYYLLMDLWGVDNLQTRAFNLTLWALRRWLLGLDKPCPEQGLTTRRLAAMMAYSVYSWLYRFFLYLGIAIVVYHHFTKLVGAMVFAVDVWWFIFMPVYTEVKQTVLMRKQLRPNPRLLTTLAVLGCLLLWLGLPLPRSVSAPAVLMADKSQVIYAPFSGQVEQLGVKRMDQVSEGHLLLTIGSRELEAELKVQELEIRVIAQEMDLLALSEEGRSMLKQKEEELEAVKARVQKLNSQLAQNQIRAEVAGLVSQWDDALVQGRYLSKDTVVGQVHAPQPRKVYAFVGEELIADIQVGDRAKFMAGDQPRAWAGVVERVSPVRKETITHLALTSLAKGDLPAVKDRRGNLVLLESHYLVEIVLEESPPGIWVGESGRAWLSSRGRSLLAQGARSSYRLLLRETNY